MARSASKVLVIGGCPRLGKTTLAKSVSKLIGDAHVVHGDAIMAAIRSAGGLVPRTPPGQWNDLEGTWARTLERDRAVTQAMVAAVRELAHYVGYEAIVAEGAYVPGNPTDMLADELSVAEIVLVNTDEDIDAEVARLRRINEADPSSWLRRYDDDLLADYARATLHRNQMVRGLVERAGVPVLDLADHNGDLGALGREARRLSLSLLDATSRIPGSCSGHQG